MTRFFRQIAIGTTLAAAVFVAVGQSQEVEPPFAWKGKGEVSFVGEYDITEMNFDFELAVDSEGCVTGKTKSDEGESTIKHMFHGERVNHAYRDYFSRKVILVLMLNEQGSEPMLAILNGRLLAGRLFVGEVMLKRSEANSEADRALGVGDSMVTPIDEDNLPYSLKSALKTAIPVGCIKIEGAYQD